MALIKSTTLPSGISGEYWKLTSFSASRENGQIVAVAKLSLFKDSSYSNATPIPASVIGFSFILTAQEIIGNVPSLLYQKIKDKNHPSLVGAVDG